MCKFLTLLFMLCLAILPAKATTVVWDGKYLACDTRASSGTEAMHIKTKIYYSPKRHAYIGFAGSLVLINQVVKWFMNSTSEDCPVVAAKDSGQSYDFILIKRDGSAVLHASADGQVEDIDIEDSHYAIGSGQPYARTALLFGFDARVAIMAASQLDEATGSQVVFYDVANQGTELQKFDPKSALSH